MWCMRMRRPPRLVLLLFFFPLLLHRCRSLSSSLSSSSSSLPLPTLLRWETAVISISRGSSKVHPDPVGDVHETQLAARMFHDGAVGPGRGEVHATHPLPRARLPHVEQLDQEFDAQLRRLVAAQPLGRGEAVGQGTRVTAQKRGRRGEGTAVVVIATSLSSMHLPLPLFQADAELDGRQVGPQEQVLLLVGAPQQLVLGGRARVRVRLPC